MAGQMSREQYGYSIIELMIVVAIIAMTLMIATFAYTPAMRAYRVKKGVQDMKAILAACRVLAGRDNQPILVTTANDQRVVAFRDKDGNGSFSAGTDELLYLVNFSPNPTDPGRPAGILRDYFFEGLTLLSSQTRTGQTGLNPGFTIAVDSGTDIESIPFLTTFSCRVLPNGFLQIRDGTGTEVPFGAVLCLHANDIQDGDVTPDRHYALAFAATGWMKTYRMNEDGEWEEY